MAKLDSQRIRYITIAVSVEPRGAQRYRLRLAFLFAVLIALTPITLLAQSGRQPEQKNSPPPSQTHRPRRAETRPPIVDPTKRPSDSRPAPTAGRLPAKDVSTAANAVEEDVVRISSNLVVVPASVLDGQGRAVTDLELADFQLLVDGQPKPLSALSRSETPVLLAVLFDNSGSLTEARRLQLQAAISFFRRVMRPIDQAAIFSVSTFPALAHPLTSDIEDLVRTI